MRKHLLNLKATYIQFSRLSTGRGEYIRFSQVGLAKVKALVSFVFSQKVLIVENKDQFSCKEFPNQFYGITNILLSGLFGAFGAF